MKNFHQQPAEDQRIWVQRKDIVHLLRAVDGKVERLDYEEMDLQSERSLEERNELRLKGNLEGSFSCFVCPKCVPYNSILP